MLYLVIGNEDLQCGEIGVEGNCLGCSQMLVFREFVLVEEEQVDEGCFQEEGYQFFDGEWCFEDIVDILVEICLVYFELEFYG